MAEQSPLVGGSIVGSFRAEIGPRLRRSGAGWAPLRELLALLRFAERVATATVRSTSSASNTS